MPVSGTLFDEDNSGMQEQYKRNVLRISERLAPSFSVTSQSQPLGRTEDLPPEGSASLHPAFAGL